MDNEIMTLTEVADYLRLAEKTVLRMIQKGEIPCTKIGSQWRFMKTMIDDWLYAKMNVVPQNDLSRLILSDSNLVPLSRIIKSEFIITDLKKGPREEILTQLIHPLVEKGTIKKGAPLLEMLLKREEMVSTAIGRGIAIPHVRDPRKLDIPGPVIVVGICPEGVSFNSLDGKDTYIFFLILTDSEVVHLRIISKLNTLIRDTDIVDRIIEAKTSREVFEIILAIEQQEMIKK